MAIRTGPCISCGLLSRIPAAGNLPQHHYSVSPEMRGNLALATAEVRIEGRSSYTNLVCFLRREEFGDFGETMDGNAVAAAPEMARIRLSVERGCPEWATHVPGLSPKSIGSASK